MKSARFLMATVVSLAALSGCSGGETTNADVAAAAKEMNAANRGVVPQPETDVMTAPAAGGMATAPKPGKR
jgi:hypothetical protein